jgi:hypothetical protein
VCVCVCVCVCAEGGGRNSAVNSRPDLSALARETPVDNQLLPAAESGSHEFSLHLIQSIWTGFSWFRTVNKHTLIRAASKPHLLVHVMTLAW